MQPTASPFAAKTTATQSLAPNQAFYPTQWTQPAGFSPAVQQFRQGHQPANFSPQKPVFRQATGPMTVNVTLSPCKAANGGHVALVNGAPASVTINYCSVTPQQPLQYAH